MSLHTEQLLDTKTLPASPTRLMGTIPILTLSTLTYYTIHHWSPNNFPAIPELVGVLVSPAPASASAPAPAPDLAAWHGTASRSR